MSVPDLLTILMTVTALAILLLFRWKVSELTEDKPTPRLSTRPKLTVSLVLCVLLLMQKMKLLSFLREHWK